MSTKKTDHTERFSLQDVGHTMWRRRCWQNWYNLLFFAGIALFFRLIPHPAHLTFFGGLALCGGATLSWGVASLLTLLPLLLSDLVYGIHATMPFVYGAFLLMVLLGKYLEKKQSLLRVGVTSLAGAIIFFVITNVGVWLTSGMYSLTLQGLVKTFYMALPFFRTDVGMTAATLFLHFATGTICSTILFFGVTGQLFAHTVRRARSTQN